MLKLFTPSVLLALHANRGHDDIKELYQRLSEFDIVNEDGSQALGVLIPCNRNYANLEDLDFAVGRRSAAAGMGTKIVRVTFRPMPRAAARVACARTGDRNDRRDNAAKQREEDDRLIHEGDQPFVRLTSSTAIEPRLR